MYMHVRAHTHTFSIYYKKDKLSAFNTAVFNMLRCIFRVSQIANWPKQLGTSCKEVESFTLVVV